MITINDISALIVIVVIDLAIVEIGKQRDWYEPMSSNYQYIFWFFPVFILVATIYVFVGYLIGEIIEYIC